MSEEKEDAPRRKFAKTPADWVEELELHGKKVDRIKTRYGRANGGFTLAEVVKVDSSGEDLYNVELRTEGGKVWTEELTDVDAQAVIEYLWSGLCQAGLEVAAANNLKRMRGEIDMLDAEGELLNSPSTSRHRLQLQPEEDEANFEDETKERRAQSLYSELVAERKQVHALRKQLKSRDERDEDRSEKRHDLEMKLLDRIEAVGRHEIQFVEYKSEQIRKDLEGMVAEARKDFVLEEIMKVAGPKLGMLMDAAGVYLRTGGGKHLDGRYVPDIPPKVQSWLVSEFHEEIAGFMLEYFEARATLTSDEDHTARWLHVLGVLNETLANHKPDKKTAALLKAWGNSACAALKVDKHMFSRVCFLEGEDPPPEPEKESSADQESDDA